MRRGGPALVRHADDEAGRRRIQRELEGLGGHGAGPGQAGHPPGLAQDLGRPERRVLGRAAPGDDDRGPGLGRRANGRRERRRRPAGRRVARQDPSRELGLGLDHLGHVIRRTRAEARGVGGGPRIGRAGQGSEWIELGRRHRLRIGAARRRSLRRFAGSVTIRRSVPRWRYRMQVGLMTPQGWKGEYDGWAPADAWARTVELSEQAEALGFESLWVFDHFHTVPAPDRGDHVRVVLRPVRDRDGDRARPPRPHGRLHRVPEPGAHGEAVVHDRRHQRRPVRARHRCRLEGRRVAGVRLRLPDDRRADGRVRRPPRGHHRDVRAGPGELRG